MARWWMSSKGLAFLACLSRVASEEAPWTVQCNADCGGVNTCAEKQLCEGTIEETSTCPDAEPCLGGSGSERDCWPKDCQWGEWRDWANDGVSGLCTRTRQFSPSECGGQQCLGTTKDTMYCDPLVHPPSPCEFDEWGPWEACDSQTLQRSRSRKVKKEPEYGGTPCNGALKQTEPCGARHPPVPCILGDWMEWSGCTRPCGGGQQTQVRAITQEAAAGGKLCEGENGSPLVLQKTRPCNMDIACGGEEAPQDCLLSEWGEWSKDAPNTAKMQRQQFRSRSIAVPGKNGGQACSQSLEETKGYDEASHALPPVDCRLSDWGAWSLCDKSCQGGQSFRVRAVEVEAARGGKPCQDSQKELMPCNEMSCELDAAARDCHLSVWVSWSDCSTSCGQGMRTRTREVAVLPLAGGKGCSADMKQVEACPHNPPCEAEDCVWGTWTEWSECSRTCDGGQKLRNRTVLQAPSKSGKACHALESVNEIATCGTASCASSSCHDGVWHDWGAWGQCSRACAGGLKWRHRKVAVEAAACGEPAVGPAMEASRCNEFPCEEDRDCVMGLWTSWSECSASCYGQQLRKREIVQHGTGHGKWCMDPDYQPSALEESRPCNGPEGASAEQQEDCGFGEVQDCLLSSWTRWSTCSKSCGGGLQHRARHALRQSKLGGKPCEGELTQGQSCNTHSCGLAMDCEWEEWDQWGACTRCDGEKLRVREIRHLGNDLGTPCEASNSREVAQCNECPKLQTYWCVWSEWQDGACSASCGTGGRLERRRKLETLSAPPHNLLDAVGNVSGMGASCEAYEVTYTTCSNVPSVCTDCVPEACEFAEWGEWQKPTTCNGICTRERRISKLQNDCGAACDGNLKETKKCLLDECSGKQDCVFSHWSEWEGCSDVSRQQTRLREIAAMNGPFGKACSGSQKETKPCEVEAKTRDCALTPWTPWGECSKKCGGGQKERTRQVADHALHGGKPCKGPLKQLMECGQEICLGADLNSEDCLLSDWSEWTGCSQGTQAYRVRSPKRKAGPTGLPCSGALKEAGPCPQFKEARHCIFSDWGQWGACGATCGGGQRFRTREVKNDAEPGGIPCTGNTHETETCNEEVACDLHHDCVISQWSLWSECSVSCGSGLFARERKILQAASSGRGCNVVLWEVNGCHGEHTSASCDDHVDCQWGEWKDWSECKEAEFCGLGYRSRARQIAVPPKGMGEKCDPLPEEEVVPDISCAKSCTQSSVCTNGQWGDWSAFGACSVTCGRGGTRTRLRTEKIKANHCGYPPEGSDKEYAPCDAEAECESEMGAQDCQFGSWSEWQDCSSSCNGERKRTRAIARYSAYGGTPCEGSIAETQRCNPGPDDQGPPLGCVSGAPVKCVQWPPTDWSSCSATCGTGHQTRRHEVAVQPAFGGASCPHPLEETRECQALSECVVVARDCALTEWEEWSQCDPFSAQRFRRRQVKYAQVGAGKACEGDMLATESCSRVCEDKTYFCQWANWEEWSACSQSCGTRGRRHRSRGLTLTEAKAEAPKAPAPKAAEVVQPGPDVASVDTAMAIEQFQLLRRLERASGSRHELVVSFLAGVGCFAALAGLGKLILRRWAVPAVEPRSLLLPFAPNSGEDGWREVEARPTEEA